jgi:hypothetical protein
VPKEHRTDRLTAAVNKLDNPEEFTQRYKALLSHYNLKGCKTQASSPNENGDIEQRHYRFKQALEQSLMLRGTGDFSSREEYESFLQKLFAQLNAGRKDRFKEEQDLLGRLPPDRLNSYKRLKVRVGPSSTIRVNHNVYSVHSRLIRETIEVRLYMEYLEIWYAQQKIETLPRLRGESKYHIQYRHIIDWLIRKPGAFENYRYRNALFPTHRFRMAYDWLKEGKPSKAAKEYLGILHLAAMRNEAMVDYAIRTLIGEERAISIESIEIIMDSIDQIPSPADVTIGKIDLGLYDALLNPYEEVQSCCQMN